MKGFGQFFPGGDSATVLQLRGRQKVTLKDLADAVADQRGEMDRLAREGVARAPTPQVIAFFVRIQREMLGWQPIMLAGLADVSLSTIERIERGDPVAPKSLDRVAVALRQPPGSFTIPRVPIGAEAAWKKLEQNEAIFDGRIEVPVRPLEGHRMVADLARADLYNVDASRLDRSSSKDVDTLKEWLDLASFIIESEASGSLIDSGTKPVKRRDLYKDILNCVRNIEKLTHAVTLAGTYKVPTNIPGVPTATVALIAFFPKLTDPAAIRRKFLLAQGLIEHADLVPFAKEEGE